jgi:hypothetical protein
MRREAAVQFLRNECAFDPALDEADAEALWKRYRNRVDALPERRQGLPQEFALSPQERAHAKNCRSFLASSGIDDVLEVVKLDLLQLTALQHYVVTERSQALALNLQQPDDWLAQFLPLSPRSNPIRYSFRHAAPATTCVEFVLPHAEFIFQPNPALPGNFHLVEYLHHATVMKGADRIFLSTGYHRSLARIMAASAQETPCAVLAVVRNTLEGATATGNVSVGAPTAVDPLGPLGTKAARIGDYFTDGLYFEADLLMRRFELQIKATVVALDERRHNVRPAACPSGRSTSSPAPA